MSDPILDVDVLTLRGIIAAAEERGRRRGVEERDELRDRMHQTIAFLLSCVASGEKLSDEEEAGIRAMLREGLAPRDSAPAMTDVPNGPRCWCGKPSRHQSGWCGRLACQGGAPRDSGKEP